MPVDAASELPVPLGSVIAGKYRVERVLGMGGMGVVAVGRHLKLDQKVAIKILRPAARSDHELVERFAREARAASRISSEHVARVIDVGETEDFVPFMVMEYLDGSDLGKVVRERGTLPPREAVDYVLQACEALAEAHRAGIVHRDLKPANLFLARRVDGSPLVKVLDFGISKLRLHNLDSEDLTKSEVIMGSPHYMSPEQLRSPRGVDARADIWALGAILYKLVTGDPPFMGATTAELCVQVLTQIAPRLSTKRADIPAALDEAVARCLEPDLTKRFASVGDLAQALGAVASDDGHSSIRAIVRVMNLPEGSGPKSSIPPPAPEERAAALAAAELLPGTFGASTLAPVRAAQRRVWTSLVIAVVAGGLLLGGSFGAWRAIRHGEGEKGSATGAPVDPARPQVAPFAPPPPPPSAITLGVDTTAADTPPVKSEPSAAPPANPQGPADNLPRRSPAVATTSTGPRPPVGSALTPARPPPAPPPTTPRPEPTSDLGFGDRK